jgi:hypothetical protein
MKFVLLIYQGTTPLPGSDRWKPLTEAEKQAIYTEYSAFNQTVGITPGLPMGLPTAARTVQLRNGAIDVKNGTYLPEGVGGYCVLEAENIEAAIALAAKFPEARFGGAIEVRPAEAWPPRPYRESIKCQ